MIPLPVALGLHVCEKIIVEERTRNVTLVSMFSRLNVLQFPSSPQKFAVYAILTDGEGDAILEFAVTHLGTDDEVYSRRIAVHFPDRLMEVRVRFRVEQCSFPTPGDYQLALWADGDLIAQRVLRVFSAGSQS